MPTFKDAFWEDPRVPTGSVYNRGPKQLCEKLEQGRTECDEVLNFLRDRMLIEEQYADALQRLADRPFIDNGFGNDEGGTSMKRAFEGLQTEVRNYGTLHAQFAQELKMDIIRNFSTFVAEHREGIASRSKKIMEHQKSLQLADKKAEKARADYFKKIELVERMERKEGIHRANMVPKIPDRGGASRNKKEIDSIKKRYGDKEKSGELGNKEGEKEEKEGEDERGSDKESEGERQGEDVESEAERQDKHEEEVLNRVEDDEVQARKIFVGPLVLTEEEFGGMIKRLMAEIPQREVKYGILGTLRGLVNGEDLAMWFAENNTRRRIRGAKQGGGVEEEMGEEGGDEEMLKTDDEILDVCQGLVADGYLRCMGRGSEFIPKATSYYQWKNKAIVYKMQRETERSNERREIEKREVEKKLPAVGVDGYRADSSQGNRATSWFMGLKMSIQSKDSLEDEIEKAEETYEENVKTFEKLRVEFEDDLMEFYEMMEAWELNRLTNIRISMKQYIKAATQCVLSSVAVCDRMQVYEESIKPEQDLRLTVEQQGVGRYWPRPKLFMLAVGKQTDFQIFGTSLEEQMIISTKTEPLVVAKCLSAIKKRTRDLDHRDRYSIWTSTMNLAKVHMLRAEINNRHRITLKTLRNYDTNVIANTLILYLLELPDCLLSRDLYEPIKALYSVKEFSIESKAKTLSNLLSALSPAAISTVKALASHFIMLTDGHDALDDDGRLGFIQQISQKVGDVILRPHSHSIRASYDTHPQKLFSDMILYYDQILDPITSTRTNMNFTTNMPYTHISRSSSLQYVDSDSNASNDSQTGKNSGYSKTSAFPPGPASSLSGYTEATNSNPPNTSFSTGSFQISKLGKLFSSAQPIFRQSSKPKTTSPRASFDYLNVLNLKKRLSDVENTTTNSPVQKHLTSDQRQVSNISEFIETELLIPTQQTSHSSLAVSESASAAAATISHDGNPENLLIYEGKSMTPYLQSVDSGLNQSGTKPSPTPTSTPTATPIASLEKLNTAPPPLPQRQKLDKLAALVEDGEKVSQTKDNTSSLQNETCSISSSAIGELEQELDLVAQPDYSTNPDASGSLPAHTTTKGDAGVDTPNTDIDYFLQDDSDEE
ncbi:Rho-GTPase-activating protein 8 [Zancudomyces culisetae]|uniref:Rho-GTPase-activating protein 8 n=1 Tax=Zancudomyces culisetae TaxID=1213189 RepID=A0A1R1PNQ0_ZANCU|nr:Rho-GTPase-activating protein 8 [Zancudomyces culisetae]|eukprot:OMH82580.1 Rho-GTPase-activating protein 8 [Zancudomyces culisetae]